MKKVYVSLSAIVIVLMATSSCNSNEKSTEVKQDEVITTPTKPEPVKTEPVAVKKDTARTTISIGSNGAEVKTKKGSNVNVGPGGVNVGTKDVKVDIKP